MMEAQKPRIVALLQARASSTRLPGKVLRPLFGVPMLARQIERVQRATRIDRLLIATSDHGSDDAIAALGRSLDIAVHRGSLNDVLDRMMQAARPHDPDWIVRLTGDCPLADPTLIDAAIEMALAGDYDYVSNALEPTFPDGLDVEVVRASVLESAWREATLPSEREHVTPFIHTRPDRFRIAKLRNGEDLSALRWTVDEPADFELAEIIYQKLHAENPAFGWRDVLALVRREPELATWNTRHGRNEGYLQSLEKDKS
jgi:spore coat polysaccharide biosynthesis protein SpsF